MSPKPNRTTLKNGPSKSQDIDPEGTRSVFGDKHEATERALMKQHADMLQANAIIDSTMAAELSKGVASTYTPACLAMNPNYTGENADEMPSLEEALRLQRARDREEEKFVRDFRAGRIDEDGNRIKKRSKKRRHASSESDLSEAPDSDDDEDDEHVEKHLKTLSVAPSAFNIETPSQTDGEDTGKKSQPDNGSSPKKNTAKAVLEAARETLKRKLESPTSASPPAKKPKAHDPLLSNLDKASTKLHAAATSLTTAAASLSSSPFEPPKRIRIRTKGKGTPLLTPYPGQPSYDGIHYFELLALCRERGLSSGGHTIDVRNRLVRDDENVVLGRSREVEVDGKKGFVKKRVFKNGVPGSERVEGSRVVDGDEEGEGMGMRGGDVGEEEVGA